LDRRSFKRHRVGREHFHGPARRAADLRGAALPTWLKFNAATQTFSATPPETATGGLVKVTATDASGLSASETFRIGVGAAATGFAQAIAAAGHTVSAARASLASPAVAAAPTPASPVRQS
jgi:hypothetical protein